MGLNLRIENEAQLPDGGALTYAIVGNRGADIGRDAHLDWTLPDPSRHVSGKHCEVRCQDGSYWLYDISRNGTFLNGSDRRVQSPHRLRDGDRLMIGHYIVAVEVTEESAAAPHDPGSDLPADVEDPWGGAVNAAPPIDPRDLRPQGAAVPLRPDFLQWHVDVPTAQDPGFVARAAPDRAAAPEARPAVAPVEALSWDAPPPPASPPRARPEVADWDTGDLPPPPPPEPPSPVPTPVRPVINPPAGGPWSADAKPPAPAPFRDPVATRDPVAARETAGAPMRPPMPDPVARPAFAASEAPGDMLGRFAKGAGLPAGALAGRDAGDFAETLGRLMRSVADNLKQLLDARSQTKRLARSSNQTMIAALDNNPLKFSPSGADALRTMLNPSSGYLDADKALRQSFDDLKAHQIKTFSAMQRALVMLLDDMDPQSLRDSLGQQKGVGAWFVPRRSRLWRLYESRWETRTRRHGGGMQDVFMQYFAECYDQAAEPSEGRGRSDR